MKGAILPVIAIGVGIGLMLPSGERAPPRPETSSPSAALATTTNRASTPRAPARGWATETRLTPGPGGHFNTLALVNGQPVEVVVDTGASTVALTVEDAQRAGIVVDPAAFQVIGTGASGPVRGHPVTIDSVSVDGKEVRRLQGAVLEGLGVSLLGQTYLSRITEVRMRGGEMILR